MPAVDARRGAQEGAIVSMLSCNVQLFPHVKVNTIRKMECKNDTSMQLTALCCQYSEESL